METVPHNIVGLFHNERILHENAPEESHQNGG